ncbi:urea transport system ATP-binding protein [Dyadobacter sp. BE34]|uniref:Urea transport system ATP-binding protein n=1 Tax=Dyadobacter fermentans TaxID=94254 RepID=A0ABU1R0K0_9BACT|nr:MULTISPECIES: urea ABC transporter ATP-binding subunit UrtE [Dyadobacter]MDR6806932.1 urea transport system ATP-binding protein [Dyadobacter fermentans]MDR7044674.1 urea transport system ATP-binding protein [Dyadobacter sp. BE242]MDR7198984.1 urea transport system ATP-binding protein [Dyadobacter sp. BE34]MDR7216946.1 urea transport system ATP-binding protein [Dyadobacter sp. BE31]MDR7263528.1 urea transport system ATP-binding protein [Dyadobacter sp. BE32]
MNAPILKVSSLTSAYGQSTILWGTSLEVKKGTVTTVMGRNGVGKTTLLKTIMGIVPPKDGTIEYNGEAVTKLPVFKKSRMGIAYVPQGREIIPKLTVYENLKLGLEAVSDRKAKIPEDEIYTLFPILKDFRNRLGGNLSGGQQQQLAIARALTGRPSLLLLDEPTEGIQPSISQEIGQILRTLARERGISVLLVEQKIDFASPVTDYYYFMSRGAVVSEGSAEEMSLEELQNHISL